MKMNLTDSERSRMGNANIDALCTHLEFLMDNPESISEIPDHTAIVLITDDDWVNQQNQKLEAKLKQTVPVEVTNISTGLLIQTPGPKLVLFHSIYQTGVIALISQMEKHRLSFYLSIFTRVDNFLSSLYDFFSRLLVWFQIPKKDISKLSKK